MSKPQFRCNKCNDPIQGNSELCIACFRELTIPCPMCMVSHGAARQWRPRRVQVDHIWQDMDCPSCRNQRWILRHYQPYAEAQRLSSQRAKSNKRP